MQDILDTTQDNGAGISDKQVRFEGAALTVLSRVLETGARIDLAAADYLKLFPLDAEEFHVRPDLIICVSDCLGLLLRAAGTGEQSRLLLDSATRVWRDTDSAGRLSAIGGITRIQACIGNIRRAIQASV